MKEKLLTNSKKISEFLDMNNINGLDGILAMTRLIATRFKSEGKSFEHI